MQIIYLSLVGWLCSYSVRSSPKKRVRFHTWVECVKLFLHVRHGDKGLLPEEINHPPVSFPVTCNGILWRLASVRMTVVLRRYQHFSSYTTVVCKSRQVRSLKLCYNWKNRYHFPDVSLMSGWPMCFKSLTTSAEASGSHAVLGKVTSATRACYRNARIANQVRPWSTRSSIKTCLRSVAIQFIAAVVSCGQCWGGMAWERWWGEDYTVIKGRDTEMG